jgi:hypothetical protein
MQPYGLPAKLPPDLTRVLTYWEGLKRGEAEMPFSDDVNISALPDLFDWLMLIEVSDRPVRFRLAIAGGAIKGVTRATSWASSSMKSRLFDPLRFLNSQSHATVEGRAPTYYASVPTEQGGARTAEGYARLLLPMWGDGQVGMLLDAVAAVRRMTQCPPNALAAERRSA